MAATGPINTPEHPSGAFFSVPVAAATLIYAGTLVARDAAANLVPASDTAALRVIGRAESDGDNSAGSAGDISVLVKRGVFRFANSGTHAIAAGDLLKPAYVEDNQTVSINAGNHGIIAGRILKIDSDGVYVDTRDTSDLPDALALTSAAPGALTSAQNATAAASDLTTSEALANALKANYNALQTDVVALRATVAALVTDLAALNAKLS